jgi:hypothetical protein
MGRHKPRRAGYRITHLTPPSEGRAYYRLTVPPGLAERIPEGAIFDPELTEAGLLYRIRPESVVDAEKKKPPSWVSG